MIGAIVNIILNFVIFCCNLILAPIDILISSYLPDVSIIFDNINSFIDIIISYIPFVLNATLLPNWLIVVIVDYLIFKFTIKPIVSIIKIAMKWYDRLKF